MSDAHQLEIHRWYTRGEWLRRRRHQLRIEPLCQLCFKRGVIVPATVADHVVSHRGDYNSFRLGKLRSLCAECHNTLDANNRAPARSRSCVRADGTPSDPRHWWNANGK